MRQSPNGRRPRGRHHGGGGHGGGHNGGHGGHQGGNGGNPILRDNRPRSAASLRHQTFDSNCIDLRVRGNAWQVFEKYQALARDAQSSGDRVTAENYLQHAEHYYRIIEAINEATAVEQHQRGGAPGIASPFGQQPEVPSNYYGSSGNTAAAPPPGNPNGAGPGNAGENPGNGAAPEAAQAEVQKRTPPPNPFFTTEEMEEQGGGATSPLAARR
jgi:hypothetical protein